MTDTHLKAVIRNELAGHYKKQRTGLLHRDCNSNIERLNVLNVSSRYLLDEADGSFKFNAFIYIMAKGRTTLFTVSTGS